MQSFLRHAIILTCLLLAETSCSINKKDSDKSKGLEVDVDWKKECTVHALEAGFTEAWCLTSYSGMEDAGQYFIYVFDDKKSAQIDSVKRGSPTRVTAPFDYVKARAESKVIKGSDWTKLQSILESASKLKNFDEKSFDGVQFTFIHLKATPGKANALTVEKTLEMNNPETNKVTAKKHLELINAIEKAAKP